MASRLTAENAAVKPQSILEFMDIAGVDRDGSIKMFNIKDVKSYTVLFFFALGTDSEEVRNFSTFVAEFSKLDCRIVGVTNESPLAIKRWMEKDPESGGFGFKNEMAFPILSDKSLELSLSLGIVGKSGMSTQASFILDQDNRVRYMHVSRDGDGLRRNIQEIWRLVAAFKESDAQGKAVPADWLPGGDLIPVQYSEKKEYYAKKFANSANSSSSNDNQIKEHGQLKSDRKVLSGAE